jgi:RES domain-containing protein
VGARLAGGRWNCRGTAVVYTSESLALAALESLVHVDPAEMPADLVAIPADIPDAVPIQRLEARDLPADWRAYPAPDALADLGTRWVKEGTSAVLGIPSALIPVEWNYLLSPAHADFARIRIGSSRPFAFDPRLLHRSLQGRA